MIKPKIPEGEAVRLATLRSLEILDTEPEERFDRLTRMARRLFDVPIALVSLVDRDRQWFKSRAGLDAPSTPRDISFCGHAILGDCPLVVPDALADPRFAENPLVVDEPRIRFYAGQPLRALDGSRLGTLCVIDQRPRAFTDDDVRMLQDLGAIAESEIATLEMAIKDELTELMNRRGFRVLARHSLEVAARQGTPVSLVFIDLDGFKKINDAFGHDEGDRALRAFGERLRGVARASDLVARIGGDEFVLLLMSTPQSMARVVVDRLREAVRDHDRSAQREYPITFSCGVVEFAPARHQSLDALLAEGDRLMYHDKRQGHRAGAQQGG